MSPKVATPRQDKVHIWCFCTFKLCCAQWVERSEIQSLRFGPLDKEIRSQVFLTFNSAFFHYIVLHSSFFWQEFGTLLVNYQHHHHHIFLTLELMWVNSAAVVDLMFFCNHPHVVWMSCFKCSVFMITTWSPHTSLHKRLNVSFRPVCWSSVSFPVWSLNLDSMLSVKPSALVGVFKVN